MKVKIYLNDWFFNSGIVGFLKILEHNKDNFETRKENYIELDTENLRNFHEYYFKYFFDKYDIASMVESRTKNEFEYLENNIEVTLEDKEEEKQRKEKIKLNKQRIKDTLKRQLDKIKKVDENIYNEIKEQYERIDKEETKNGIKQIKEIILINIKDENTNKRLTLNLFKSILSNSYYGQPSFLNVVNSRLSYDKQKDIMYKDYLSNIVETGFLHDILEDKYNLNEIEEYIMKTKANGNITKAIEKIYSKIETSYIKKNKTVDDIKEYIKKNVIKKCTLCENEFGLTSDYSESNFIPLAMSSNEARNFFWNQNVKFPICDICRLILFCIPAGMTLITKVTQSNKKDKNSKSNKSYEEKYLLSFVNLDTSVDNLYRTNQNFSKSSKSENRENNPYPELILKIVEQDKKISNWQLQNIFIVELETEYRAYSRIEYFNIKRYVARFFVKYSESTLSKIKDYKYKLQLVDYILKSKDFKYIINERLRDELTKDMDKRFGYNSFIATQIRLILNLLKREGADMEDSIKKNNNKLYILYNLGVEIHEELKQKNEENKLDGYTYKMLNSIKAGNKNEFMDIVIRIHMSMGKDVSPIFLEIMQDSDLDFESIGHSFLSGIISNKYEKKEDK